MKRVARAVLAGVLLAGVLNVADLALPGAVQACSCMITGPEKIGTYADEPGIVVFVGTVVAVHDRINANGHTVGDIAIHRVYKGNLPKATMTVIGGGGGDCTISIEPGQRMITAASFDGGAITPGLCMPYGDPQTPEGVALIAAATTAYGPGIVPPGAPGNEPDSPPTAAVEPALAVVLGGVAVVAAALFGLIWVVARRGRAAT